MSSTACSSCQQAVAAAARAANFIFFHFFFWSVTYYSTDVRRAHAAAIVGAFATTGEASHSDVQSCLNGTLINKR
jgi:hypothetical protein